jgi:hypothetical protein
MPIKARIDMLSTGIRTPIGVNIYGPDLADIDRLSREIKAALARAGALAALTPSGSKTAITLKSSPTAPFGGQPRIPPTTGARLGQHFANQIRRNLPRVDDKWRLDEVVFKISGVKHWLWRAVDQTDVVLDVLVQRRRDNKLSSG